MCGFAGGIWEGVAIKIDMGFLCLSSLTLPSLSLPLFLLFSEHEDLKLLVSNNSFSVVCGVRHIL